MEIELIEEERELVRSRKFLHAVVSVRKRTGAGLLEANSAVQAFAQEMDLMFKEECSFCGGKGFHWRWDWGGKPKLG